jgi:histidinol-phosphatase (PHP family)
MNNLSYRAPIKEACPSPNYLQTLAKYQIPMTLSSDAHYPDDLGVNLDLAKEQLRKYGYETLATFSKRKRYHVPI